MLKALPLLPKNISRRSDKLNLEVRIKSDGREICLLAFPLMEVRSNRSWEIGDDGPLKGVAYVRNP